MKLFWISLCLLLINGVSVSKSEVGKQVRSTRDAETSTTPAETTTTVDYSEEYEEVYVGEDEENNFDKENEEAEENPVLTREEAAYFRSLQAYSYLRSNPQRRKRRLIEPVQQPRGEQYSGFERDSLEPHSRFKGYSGFEENSEAVSPYRHRFRHYSRHSKQSRRNKRDNNGGKGNHGRHSFYRYRNNNGRDRNYNNNHRDKHGYRNRWHSDTRRLWSTELTGPDGVKVKITDPPYSKRWNCPAKATLSQLKKPYRRKGKSEYDLVKDLVKKSWTGNFGGSIQKIEKITNHCLWKRYRFRKDSIATEMAQTDVAETLLFYGAPAADLTEKTNNGFDERALTLQSSTIGGAAFDFTSSSSTADAKATANGAGKKTMLLCRATLGNAQTTAAATQLAHAPIRAHCLKLADQYAIYRGDQVYPEYLITYT